MPSYVIEFHKDGTRREIVTYDGTLVATRKAARAGLTTHRADAFRIIDTDNLDEIDVAVRNP